MAKSDLSLSSNDYAPVAERIRFFYARFPTGRIITHLVRRTDQEVVFRAEVFRTPTEREPAASGWAAEREGDGEINTVACLDNTETSAVGRCSGQSRSHRIAPATESRRNGEGGPRAKASSCSAGR